MSNKKYTHIALEGLIGAVKSAVLECLEPRLNSQVAVFQEPFEEWLALELFYQDQKTYAFALQMEILTSYKSIPQQGRFLTERSPKASVEVFSRMQLEKNHITVENLRALKTYEERFLPQPDAIIYIDVSPQKAFERIQQRGRPAENTISLNYLMQLEFYYSTWLDNTTIPVKRVDGKQPLEKVAQGVLYHLESLPF